MGDLDGSVSLVAGASSGIGKAVLREFARRGSYTIGASRSEDVLSALADETGGEYVVFDATQDGAVDSLVDQVLSTVAERDASRLFVVYTSGMHETPVFGSDEGGWDYSKPEHVKLLHGEGYLDAMQAVNVSAPARLFSRLLFADGPRTDFLYTSTQAAEADPWWGRGNSVYGPQNYAFEQLLKAHPLPDEVRAVATRYPFVDTPMADKLYDQLSKVEDLPPKDEMFEPVDKVAGATVDLLTARESAHFSPLDAVVYNYEK